MQTNTYELQTIASFKVGVVPTPETGVRWHRGGFRLYWSLISRVRRPVGRKKLSKEVRDLIFRMVGENRAVSADILHFLARVLAVYGEGRFMRSL